MADKKELAIVPTEVEAKDLKLVMIGEAEKRGLLTEYISTHMKEGADYGTINIGGRPSKPSLFKPGSEKFLSLFKLVAKFEKDTDTWEMAGSVPGLFCYKCNLIASNGAVVGEGRGAANLQEKNNWTVNNAVKIAEKRAQIDAVLRTGALSDFFTQDLEDMQPERPRMRPYSVPRRVAAQDDEADGAVIQMDAPRGKYPAMTPKNDAHPLMDLDKPEQPKDTVVILQLLSELGKASATPKIAKMNIKILTGGLKDGITWAPGDNDEDVIEALRKLHVERMNHD